MYLFNRVSTIECETITPDKRFVDEEIRKMLAQHPEIQFINMEGNLSMGAAGSLVSKVKINENASKVIFRMREIHHIDLSGLEAFKDLIKEIKSQNKEAYLTSINNLIDMVGILD